MTTPQELRQAAAQAKEALEDARYKLYGYGPSNPRLDAALSALSAVLEKQDSSHLPACSVEARSGSGVPARPTLPGELQPCPFCGHVGLDFGAGSTFRWRTAECSTCGASTGEERIQTSGRGTQEEWEADVRARLIAAWNRRDLAASPLPQEGRTPLTDEAIRDLATPYYPDSIQFARRIEAAHGIGTQGEQKP